MAKTRRPAGRPDGGQFAPVQVADAPAGGGGLRLGELHAVPTGDDPEFVHIRADGREVVCPRCSACRRGVNHPVHGAEGGGAGHRYTPGGFSPGGHDIWIARTDEGLARLCAAAAGRAYAEDTDARHVNAAAEAAIGEECPGPESDGLADAEAAVLGYRDHAHRAENILDAGLALPWPDPGDCLALPWPHHI